MRSSRNSTSSRVENQLKTIELRTWERGRFKKRELHLLILVWIRDVAIVLAVAISGVLLIKRRSRIYRKQDLDTEEIWSDMVSDESNMTPRLRTESDGVIVILESETLESDDDDGVLLYMLLKTYFYVTFQSLSRATTKICISYVRNLSLIEISSSTRWIRIMHIMHVPWSWSRSSCWCCGCSC